MKLQQRIFSVAAFAVGLFLFSVMNAFAQIYSYFTNTIDNVPYQELPADRVVLPAEDFRDPLNSSILDPDDGFYYNPATGESLLSDAQRYWIYAVGNFLLYLRTTRFTSGNHSVEGFERELLL